MTSTEIETKFKALETELALLKEKFEKIEKSHHDKQRPAGFIQPGWSDDQKLYQALDAMGYSDDYGVTGDDDTDSAHTGFARSETRRKTGERMLDDIKGAK